MPLHTWHLHRVLLSNGFSAPFHQAHERAANLPMLGSFGASAAMAATVVGFARGNNPPVAWFIFSYSSFGAEIRPGCRQETTLNGAGLPMMDARPRKGLGSPFRYCWPSGTQQPERFAVRLSPSHARADKWKCRPNATPRPGTWPMPRTPIGDAL